jgi:hypothetical protein
MNVTATPEHDHRTHNHPSRRAVLGLALGAALGGVGLPVGLASAKPKRKSKGPGRSKAEARRRPTRRRKPRFKIVIRTFVSLIPITIPLSGPATSYPATIPVGGLRAGEILDVNVTLSGLSNDWSRYLDVVLVAPGGLRTVVLMSDVGGIHDIANVTLVFDDQAASFLPYLDRIVSGTYKPTAPGVAPVPDTATLRSFNGLNPNGSWRLYVADSLAASATNIAGWALTIKARVRV